MAQTIDRLLNLVPDKPEEVLQHLQQNPSLASAQDAHGYSLVHAAASYNHADLLRTLISTYNVDPNLRDEDGETALYSVETVDMARVLVEEFHIDINAQNDEDQTAAQKFESEEEFPRVAEYLRRASGGSGAEAAEALTQGVAGNPSATAGTVGEQSNGVPPPLPNGVKIDLGTMGDDDIGEAPDPEFRRRIDELASRPDFQSEENQRELRNLVQDALMGVTGEDREVRQRRE